MCPTSMQRTHSEVIHRLAGFSSPVLRRRIQSDCRDDTGGGVDMPRVAQNMWVVQFCSHPKNSGRVPAAHEGRDWGGVRSIQTVAKHRSGTR